MTNHLPAIWMAAGPRRSGRWSARQPGKSCAVKRSSASVLLLLYLFLQREARSGLLGLEVTRQGRFQFGRYAKLPDPVTQVALVQFASLYLHYAGHVPKLTVGRRDAVPIKLVQNDILGRGQPEGFAKPDILQPAAKHFPLERNGPQQPEIGLQGRGHMNNVELMGWLIGGAQRGFVQKVIRAGERLHQSRDLRRWQLNDKVEVVRGARNAPGFAGDGAGEHILDAARVKAVHAIQKQVLFGHKVRASSSRRRSNPSTSAGVALGCCRRIPRRAISQANS